MNIFIFLIIGKFRANIFKLNIEKNINLIIVKEIFKILKQYINKNGKSSKNN